jgi:hypothetical protein
VLGFNLVVLGVYRVEETTNEEFVANAVQVEMQRHHFYTARHAVRAANAIVTYRTKHEIIDIDMV